MSGTFAVRYFGAMFSVSFAAGAAMAVKEGQPSAAVTCAIVSVALATIPLWSLYIDGKNVGRGRTRRSRLARRLAPLGCLEVRGCGCVYSDDHGKKSPGKEWTERETVWVRKAQGGRVRFRKAETGLRRCYRCGKHYSDTVEKGSRRHATSVSRQCWPEDEPDVRDRIDERVVDEEVAYD